MRSAGITPRVRIDDECSFHPSVNAQRRLQPTADPPRYTLVVMTVSASAPGRFTSAEYHRMARAGAFAEMRVELRRGVLVRMSPRYIPHARVKRLLAQALAESVSAAGLAWVVDQEVSVAFGDAFDAMPDIVVWDAAVADGEGPVSRPELAVSTTELTA